MARLSLLSALISASLAVSAQTPPVARDLGPTVREFVTEDSPLVAITHVRVVDGTGRPAADDQTIVIATNKIGAVGPAGTIKPPAGAKVIDGTGRTVVPGLVGMHEHLAYHEDMLLLKSSHFSTSRLLLANGVTTVRTAASFGTDHDVYLKRMIDANRFPGPKLHLTSPLFMGPETVAFTLPVNSFYHNMGVWPRGPDEVRQLVDFWAARGFTSYKAYTHITRSLLSALIDQAHKRGLPVTGHLCSITYGEAAELGIDNLEHGFTMMTDFVKDKKPDECPTSDKGLQQLDPQGGAFQALVKTLAARRVVVTTMPSLADRTALTPRELAVMAPNARSTYEAAIGQTPALTSNAPNKDLQLARAFVAAGGHLQLGTDAAQARNVPGFANLRGLIMLVENGFTPVEAIKIATTNGAQTLKVLDSVGTIAPGKAADLVLVNGNPAANIRDIQRIDMVFKDGVGFDPAKLLESVRGQYGYR